MSNVILLLPGSKLVSAQMNMEHAGNDAIKVTSNNKVNNSRSEGDKRQELNLDIVSASPGGPPSTIASTTSNLTPSPFFRSF